MKHYFLVICFAVSFFHLAANKHIHSFTFSQDQFLMDGKPIELISGEIDPARVPEIYWENRIQMAKAMGCNAISMYVY
jgi:hypothetical protein